MSIDVLQNKIRKLKSPCMLSFPAADHWLPEGMGYEQGAAAVMEALKDTVPALRFSLAGFALQGEQGVALLRSLLSKAKALGYYVALDAPAVWEEAEAEAAAASLSGDLWQYDALIVSPWAGSDGWKGYMPLCRQGKDIFLILRSGSRSAAQLQDLLTGSRLVHQAAADQASHYGKDHMARCGYSAVGGVSSAAAAQINSGLRGKYKNMFLLVEGYDTKGANAKNCAGAFDKFGHGAIVCAGSSILTAWKEGEEGLEEAARKAAQRMKKNILSYIQLL